MAHHNYWNFQALLPQIHKLQQILLNIRDYVSSNVFAPLRFFDVGTGPIADVGTLVPTLGGLDPWIAEVEKFLAPCTERRTLEGWDVWRRTAVNPSLHQTRVSILTIESRFISVRASDVHFLGMKNVVDFAEHVGKWLREMRRGLAAGETVVPSALYRYDATRRCRMRPRVFDGDESPAETLCGGERTTLTTAEDMFENIEKESLDLAGRFVEYEPPLREFQGRVFLLGGEYLSLELAQWATQRAAEPGHEESLRVLRNERARMNSVEWDKLERHRGGGPGRRVGQVGAPAPWWRTRTRRPRLGDVVF